MDKNLETFIERHHDELQRMADDEFKYAPVPEVDYRHIHDLNIILGKVHSQCNENGHRWCARINKQLETIVDQTCEAYCG
jgi:hypothetical protein